jgi:hypothetical protein
MGFSLLPTKDNMTRSRAGFTPAIVAGINPALLQRSLGHTTLESLGPVLEGLGVLDCHSSGVAQIY